MADTPARRELIRRARERMQEQGRRGLQRRPPRPRRPEQEIRTYRARLRDIARAMEREIRDRVFPEIDRLINEAGTREDAVRADDWPEAIANLFEATRTSIRPSEEDAKRTADQLSDKVEQNATEEQQRAIRAVIGVAPSFVDDEQIGAILNSWKRQNGAFITRFTDDEVQDAQNIVSRGVRRGTSTKDLKDSLRRQFRISDNRAQRIARTEISQLNAQITKQREKELGIEQFIWRTAGDERVRDQHEEWNGRKFAWDDPPDGVVPGEPVNCRCSASPAVDDLLDELEREE